MCVSERTKNKEQEESKSLSTVHWLLYRRLVVDFDHVTLGPGCPELVLHCFPETTLWLTAEHVYAPPTHRGSVVPSWTSGCGWLWIKFIMSIPKATRSYIYFSYTAVLTAGTHQRHQPCFSPTVYSIYKPHITADEARFWNLSQEPHLFDRISWEWGRSCVSK